jgi:succinyl-CoA synthetase beta subunit
VKIHEYQAKSILKSYGVPVPRGEVAYSPPEVVEAAKRLGGRVVIKAQIHAGGRGKGGGVKVVPGPAEAEPVARTILGMNLVTPQTGPEGKQVRRVLVEEALDIEREFYLSILLDRSSAALVAISSAEGGTEIEEVAAKQPEKILRESFDPVAGFQPYVARKLAFGLGMAPAQVKGMVRMLGSLYRAFAGTDASLVEVNPLVLTRQGDLIALDAKMNFDDNALFRHEDIRELRDLDEEEPLEVEASGYGLNYIKLDGNVGCMVNGAGLAMATMDGIKLAGGQPANFLDVGGGATAEQVTHAFRILLGDASVRAVLINIFGGIMRCDVVAQGVVEAARKVDVKVPIVVRLEGTNVEEGRRLLQESGLDLTIAGGMGEAAKKVVELAGGAAS